MGVAENIPFGLPIRDKSHVEEWICRAQRTILNPSTNYETFLSGPGGDPDGGSELSFSKNCICLELSGPDLTDLSFCDLLGTYFTRCPVVSSLKVGFVRTGLIVSVSQGPRLPCTRLTLVIATTSSPLVQLVPCRFLWKVQMLCKVHVRVFDELKYYQAARESLAPGQ